MEPEVRERFERIEAILALTAENHRIAMEKADQRMAEHDKRMAEHDRRIALVEKRSLERHKAAMERMDRTDKKMAGLQKLVQVGWKAVTNLAAEGRRSRAELRALQAEVRAYIKAQRNGHGQYRNGGNGNGHGPRGKH